MKSSRSKQQPQPQPLLFDNDKEALKEAANLQAQSKDALSRMQQELEQTQQTGAMTLEDLYEQRRRLEGIEAEGDRLHDKLDETEQLQRKLGTWFGGAFHKKSSSKNRKNNNKVAESDQKENDPDNNSNNAEKKKKWAFRKSSKKSGSSNNQEPVVNVRKGLLEDIDDADIPAEHAEELQALARGDEELDAQMDLIGDQLGTILTMAQDMGTESKHHGRKMNTIHTQLDEAAPRQKKAIQKTKRLLR